MSLKIGDRVKVKKLEPNKEYDNVFVNKDMIKCCGNHYIIKDIEFCDVTKDEKIYRLEGLYWAWSLDMLENENDCRFMKRK